MERERDEVISVIGLTKRIGAISAVTNISSGGPEKKKEYYL